MKNPKIKKKASAAGAVLIMGLLSAHSAFAADSFLGNILESVSEGFEPVREYKGVIMAIVAFIGIILIIVAYGSNSSSQGDNKMTGVIKGSILVSIVIEAFMLMI